MVDRPFRVGFSPCRHRPKGQHGFNRSQPASPSGGTIKSTRRTHLALPENCMAAILVATNGVGSHVGVKRLVATGGHDRGYCCDR